MYTAARTHAPTHAHVHMHARTHGRARTGMHARTHTHPGITASAVGYDEGSGATMHIGDVPAPKLDQVCVRAC